jgi:hypothetical protein
MHIWSSQTRFSFEAANKEKVWKITSRYDHGYQEQQFIYQP